MSSSNAGGQPPVLDCLIVGAGPAGLMASIYLARFRRSLRVFDAGNSRALKIPVSHNFPAFPEGIRGPEILSRMRAQAGQFGVQITQARVEKLLRHDDSYFHADTSNEHIIARHVILATGAADVEPDVPFLRDAIRSGHVRHCPVCDAFEVIDHDVAVVGTGSHLFKEAMFIRHYTPTLSVFSLGREIALSDAQHDTMRSAGIKIIEEPVAGVCVEEGQVKALRAESGKLHHFDTLYAAMGSTVRSELASACGAELDSKGNLVVDYRRFETSIPGLFAAGDVVRGLSQIAVGAGQAAVIATAIHHNLSRQSS